MTTPVLDINGLVAGYDKKLVLHGITMNACQREVVALIGHNGSGKTTLLRSIFGLIPVVQGSVKIRGAIVRPSPSRMIKLGLAYIPQGNRVFADLTVAENLEMGGITVSHRQDLNKRLEDVFDWFPVLEARLTQRAGTLSGGEQQMLALANALLQSPHLLLMDEPSLGLAPSFVKETLARIRGIAERGTTVLIAEQRVREVMKVADRVYVLRNGLVSFSGAICDLNDTTLREVYF
jgi:branched-chain amino acid transport system ATP-binding protein